MILLLCFSLTPWTGQPLPLVLAVLSRVRATWYDSPTPPLLHWARNKEGNRKYRFSSTKKQCWGRNKKRFGSREDGSILLSHLLILWSVEKRPVCLWLLSTLRELTVHRLNFLWPSAVCFPYNINAFCDHARPGWFIRLPVLCSWPMIINRNLASYFVRVMSLGVNRLRFLTFFFLPLLLLLLLCGYRQASDLHLMWLVFTQFWLREDWVHTLPSRALLRSLKQCWDLSSPSYAFEDKGVKGSCVLGNTVHSPELFHLDWPLCFPMFPSPLWLIKYSVEFQNMSLITSLVLYAGNLSLTYFSLIEYNCVKCQIKGHNGVFVKLVSIPLKSYLEIQDLFPFLKIGAKVNKGSEKVLHNE